MTVDKTTPELSLVIPCYNEEDSVASTVQRIVTEFHLHDASLELILVDNGSTDSTGEIIDAMIDEGLPVRKVVVKVNQGYGLGALTGLKACRGRWVGISCADEQVEASDIYKLAALAAKVKSPKLFKVRRRFRLEGPFRNTISFIYNLLTNALFGGLGSMDLNGSPKLMPRAYAEAMNLQSKDWFLDPEIMIKAKKLELPVFEMNIFSLARSDGASNVKPATCWEFLVNLWSHRFGSKRHVFEGLSQPASWRSNPSGNAPDRIKARSVRARGAKVG